MGRLKSGRRGGLSLEAALVLPFILLLACLAAWLLQAIGAEIKLKGALDRTAAELSLLSPICELLNQAGADWQAKMAAAGTDTATSAALDCKSLLEDIWPEERRNDFLADAALDLASSTLLGSLLQSRLDYWLNETCAGQPAWLVRLGQRQLYLDWRLDRQQLWLCLAYDLATPAGISRRRIDVVVPLWIGRGEPAADAGDQIWLMDNFSRGKSLRQLFGANLPADFPVLARFDNGDATAIKSMDLTAPTYQNPDEIRFLIGRQISQLAVFPGAVRKRGDQVWRVAESDIQTRRLLLVIPQNCRQSWLPDLWRELTQLAATRDVSLDIRAYGSSARYTPAED